MPTGYTAAVADGKVTEFRTFALRCARAFGATIMQRDNPMDELPKLREVEPYYAEHLAASRHWLDQLTAMSPDDVERAAEATYRKALAQHEEYASNRAATRQRYEAMLAEVLAWEPPTAGHAGLKEFMERQLRESLDFDCNPRYEPEPPKRLSGPVWLADELGKAARRVEHRTTSVAEEEERCRKANEWITALYDSLTRGPAEQQEGGRHA